MKFDNYALALIGVLIIGVLALGGFFWRMKAGFGPFNFKVLAIVLVAIFATVLGLADLSHVTASIGILGAIVGYAFGAYKNSDA